MEFSWVHSSETLKTALQVDGLCELYDAVFGGPPDHQQWGAAEVNRWFGELFEKGKILLVYNPENHKCVGFCAVLPFVLASAYNNGENQGFSTHPFTDPFPLNQEFWSGQGIDITDAWYIAELGVASTLRRRGIAQYLLQEAVAVVPPEVKHVLLRVTCHNESANSLYEKIGFTSFQFYTQTIVPTVWGAPLTLAKKFMYKTQ